MSKINKYNYEAFMLDFMEGNLSENLTIELMAFANENPELAIDIFNNVADFSFSPEVLEFAHKDELKVTDNSFLYNQMIAAVEGELSEAEIERLTAEVKAKNLEKAFSYFKASKLIPDTAMVYEDKAMLKVTVDRIIPLNYWKIASVAAAAVVIISVFAYNLSRTPTTEIFSPTAFGEGVVDLKTANKSKVLNHVKRFRDTEFNQEILRIYKENSVALAPDLEEIKIDSLKEKFSNKDHEKNIVAQQEAVKDSTITPSANLLPENYALANSPSLITKKSEPYSLVTNTMENVVNKDIAYVKEEVAGDGINTVTHRVNIGKFSFERKISK